MWWFNKYKKGKQWERLLKLLLDNEDKEISCWDIVHKCNILHYTNVIMILRKKGYFILNRTELKYINGEKIKYSFYKLKSFRNNENVN